MDSMQYLSYSKPCPIDRISSFYSSDYDYSSPFDMDPPEDDDKRRKFKSKNWVFVVYPDDPNFEQQCLKVRFADCVFVISPLHIPEDEEKKQKDIHGFRVYSRNSISSSNSTNASSNRCYLYAKRRA